MIVTLSLLAIAAIAGKTLFDTKPGGRPPEPEIAEDQGDAPASAPGLVSLRDQQLGELSGSGKPPATSEVEKEADRYLKIVGTALAMSAVGYVAFPPLALLSVPVTIYAHLPFLKLAAQDIERCVTEKPRLTMDIVDGIIVVTMFATGSYFAAALISTLNWVSRKMVVKAEDHAQKSLTSVFSEQPRFVWQWLASEGVEVQLPFERIKPGDVVVVHAGELIPADGRIVHGNASVDQRILTGEAQPAEKGIGDRVFASTIVLSGAVRIEVEKAGQDTVAAEIGNILHRTSEYAKNLDWQWKKFVDDISPLTLLAGVATWPFLGVKAAVGMLISVNFGYSMRVIAPLTLLNFLNLSSKSGILIKDGRVLEQIRRIDTVVFDKTGTLTEETPTVGHIHCVDGHDAREVLRFAAAAEFRQTHPVALALIHEAGRQGIALPQIDDAQYEVGYGIKVRLDGASIHVGSPRYMALEGIAVPDDMAAIRERSLADGNTLICVAVDRLLVGMIELQPTVRPEAKEVIAELKRRGLGICVISGDHERATQRLARELGIDKYFAETLPENKSVLIEQLQAEGKVVCFVGDGINDSIALKTANVSVSLSGASSVAKDTASIILMDADLQQLVLLLDIARDFEKVMKNSFKYSTIPTFASITGVLALHLRIVGTILLYFAGLGVGVGSSVKPLLDREKRPGPLPAQPATTPPERP